MKTAIQIRIEVRAIAGCAWDDMTHSGTLAECIRSVANYPPEGSDGDFTDDDRAKLLALAKDAAAFDLQRYAALARRWEMWGALALVTPIAARSRAESPA